MNIKYPSDPISKNLFIMKNCIIGYTGFIGKKSYSSKKFSNFYNSKNIHNIHLQKFHTTIICAPHGKKWWANKY